MEVQSIHYLSPNAPELFCESLKETGFAVLNHHPISVDLIKTTYQIWQNFFASENKFKFIYQKPKQDGYFPFRTEKAKNSRISDLKEFYHFYAWGKQPVETQEKTQQLFNELITLASELLQWIENFLPHKTKHQLSTPLKNMINQSPNTLLRILHYPPIDFASEQEAVRAAPHEDINLLTLLPAATSPGLEVLSVSGIWHAVNCDPGNIVVNVGDMLQKCTHQYYKSTTHRVINPRHSENVSRFSMPLFLHPHPDVKLSKSLTAEMVLHERLRQIGIY